MYLLSVYWNIRRGLGHVKKYTCTCNSQSTNHFWWHIHRNCMSQKFDWKKSLLHCLQRLKSKSNKTLEILLIFSFKLWSTTAKYKLSLQALVNELSACSWKMMCCLLFRSCQVCFDNAYLQNCSLGKHIRCTMLKSRTSHLYPDMPNIYPQHLESQPVLCLPQFKQNTYSLTAGARNAPSQIPSRLIFVEFR